MEIIIKKTGNGIHSYLKMDVLNMNLDGEIVIVEKIFNIINKYNEEQIEKA